MSAEGVCDLYSSTIMFVESASHRQASVGVGASVECQTGVMVVVERTEALVARDAESKALSHCLYGQLAELLYGFLIHDVK